MRFAELVATSRAVADAPGRIEKIEHLARLLARLEPADVEIAITFLSGALRQRGAGVAATSIREAADVAPAIEPTLTVTDVDTAFAGVALRRGRGSARDRTHALRSLFAQATAEEQTFLVRLLFGELRQGAVEGVLVDAVARASGIGPERVRRAAMMAGALAPVAAAALTAGESALARFAIAPFVPVQPMLAGSAGEVSEAVAAFDRAAVEYKLDGARIQIHKLESDVRAYSRSLRDVSAAVPDIIEIVRGFPARALILDGETLALRSDGTPHPFQVTMRRFGRKADAADLRAHLPLTPFFFDCLYVDGQPLVDDTLARRVAVLDDLVPSSYRVPRLQSAAAADAIAFSERAQAAGHEGVMVKSLDSIYAAGRRGASWLKVKRPRTLDLVVLAAEWGSGRRRGWLSNLHLGARDAGSGAFVMLGKTFKGLTDELLTWQTRELLAREIARDAWTVYVRPELVVEVAFNELQASPTYPGGIALRFARVKQYRTDKAASEADTFETVQRLFAESSAIDSRAR